MYSKNKIRLTYTATWAQFWSTFGAKIEILYLWNSNIVFARSAKNFLPIFFDKFTNVKLLWIHWSFRMLAEPAKFFNHFMKTLNNRFFLCNFQKSPRAGLKPFAGRIRPAGRRLGTTGIYDIFEMDILNATDFCLNLS